MQLIDHRLQHRHCNIPNPSLPKLVRHSLHIILQPHSIPACQQQSIKLALHHPSMFCANAHHSMILLSSRISTQPSCSCASSHRSLRTLPSYRKVNTQPHRLQSARLRARAMGQSPNVEEDTRKEVFEVAANNILKDDGLQKKFNTSGASSKNENGRTDPEGRNGGAKKKGKEEEATMPEELELAQRHPLDPHKPNFSEFLPEALRPYPSFEGWFVRIVDPETKFSAAVILATNYATDESQVTLLFALGKSVVRDGGRDAVNHGFTYAVAAKTKDAKFLRKENNEEWGDDKGERPVGFEWDAGEIGRFIVTPHNIDLDFTVEGYHFKAHLTKELLWDAHKSEKGPEGWARFVSIIPTHWYVYSLGSTVDYTFSNPEKDIHHEGSAHGHVEKNWGQTFPAGHVWLQAFAPDNTSQLCFSGAYFNTPNEALSSPYLFVLGYRSPKLQLDFRTNDIGIVFKDKDAKPREGSFSITAVGPSHTIELKTSAPFDTFSDAVLAPMTKVDWKPACRESFVATAEVKVYEHLAWGIPGTSNLVETQNFEFAALEFGEDLLKEGEESEENQN